MSSMVSGSRFNQLIEMAGLKVYALKELDRMPVLRALILSEKDLLSSEEFLAKMEVWIKLFELGK